MFVETTADCVCVTWWGSHVHVARTREKGEIGGVEKDFECPLWVSPQCDDGGKNHSELNDRVIKRGRSCGEKLSIFPRRERESLPASDEQRKQSI